MADRFVTCSLEEILVGEALPVNLYIYLNFRFITYRGAGDSMDRLAYEKFELCKVRNLFIMEKDQKAFQDWSAKKEEEITGTERSPMSKGLREARADAHRATMDIFSASHPDKVIEQTVKCSKRLVTEVMKQPYAVKNLAMLQTFSKGTADHSVNVSVLSTYLAMQMGYTSSVILQHVSMGALMHDMGKINVPYDDQDSPEDHELKMEQHPLLGAELLESQEKVPNEVKMIVAQHHERHDGTGYPKKLRANAIYDLARIVSIANVFDDLVSDGTGALVVRQRAALQKMDGIYRQFDPRKLEKALKILKLGV